MASTPSAIFDALEARLAQIRIAHGYATDAGERIYRGREEIHGDTEVYPCITVLKGDDETQQQVGHKVRVFAKFTVVGLCESDPDHPLDSGHALEADLVRALFPAAAVEAGNDRLEGTAINVFYDGGLVAARDDGGRTTGAVVNLRVEFARHLYQPQ